MDGTRPQIDSENAVEKIEVFEETAAEQVAMNNRTETVVPVTESVTEENNRKVIQISACGHENTISTQSDVSLFALCSDGSMWVLSDQSMLQWRQLPPIPEHKS